MCIYPRLLPFPYQERKQVEELCEAGMSIPIPKKRLGILTSGGDAQGMNAVIRAVIRTAIERGMEVYAIKEGYQGLVDGGESIRKMNWDSVGGILQKGGTIIGTARCEAFRTREGRRQAALN
jgi:6-phosphofructokinase 1